MRRRIKASLVDRAFELEAALGGSRCTYVIGAFGAQAPPFAGVTDFPGVVSVRQEADRLEVVFDHAHCDGLGALNVLRAARRGLPVQRIDSIDMPAEPRTPKVRRYGIARTFGRVARLVEPEVRSEGVPTNLLFSLSAREPSAMTVTERVTAACHDVALRPATRRRTCSAVLVSITAVPWSVTRPANNLSSAFWSVVAQRQVDDIESVVQTQFRVAKTRRFSSLQRIARFGRIPRVTWPLLERLGRLTSGSGAGTAIVSNLGRVEDQLLAATFPNWYAIGPVRDRRCVFIGLLGVQGKMFASVSAVAPDSEVRNLAGALWRACDFDAVEVEL